MSYNWISSRCKTTDLNWIEWLIYPCNALSPLVLFFSLLLVFLIKSLFQEKKTTESCKLEIVIHSGNGLTNIKPFGTMNPYVLVYLTGENEKSPEYKTETAIKGASCPVWNGRVKFNIASRYKNYTLFCVIKHGGTFFDQDIGQVQVPLKDLLAGGVSGENVSYPVTTSSGKIGGEIILSHTISFGDYISDMRTIETENEGQMGQFAKSVITEVASQVAQEVIFGLFQ